MYICLYVCIHTYLYLYVDCTLLCGGNKEYLSKPAIIQLKTFLQIYAQWNFPLSSIGPVQFRFKGCWVIFFIFIQILIERPVSK